MTKIKIQLSSFKRVKLTIKLRKNSICKKTIHYLKMILGRCGIKPVYNNGRIKFALARDRL
jgi:hypothetical protein